MNSKNYIQDMSIKDKMRLIILVVTFLTITVGFTIIGFWNINRQKTEIQSGLLLNSKLVASYCVAPLTFEDDKQATNVLSQLNKIEIIEHAILIDKNEKVFATYPDTLLTKNSLLTISSDGINYKDGYFYIKEPVSFDQSNLGTLYIKANSSALSAAKLNMLILIFGLMIIMVIISYFLASMMQKFISKPILILSHHFNEIAINKDFTSYVSKQGNDEVGQLYDGFNNILTQINDRQFERDKAMSSLIESEERNQVLLDISPIGLVLTKLDGSIIEMNSAFLRILGRNEEELLRLSLKDISPKKFQHEDQLITKKVEDNGFYGPYEKEFIQKDGSIIPVVLNGNLLEREGEKFVWSSVSDITEQKKAEEEIKDLLATSEKSAQALLSILEDEQMSRQEIKELNKNLEIRVKERTQQLENANKEMEAFSYSVSHDLRAPLRHINGYIDMLKNQFPDSLPTKGMNYMNTIADSSRQMGVLIDDLLHFSRTGRQEIKKSKTNMNLIIEQVYQEINLDIQDRNIEWNTMELPFTYCDAALITQVWVNLLNNAVKFTSKNEKAIIDISFRENEKYFVFCVADNGVGFDMKYADKLFGVFQRLHSKADYEGTGIGLANVQRIILRHSGKIWAEAELNKGAKFYFTIPKEIKEMHE